MERLNAFEKVNVENSSFTASAFPGLLPYCPLAEKGNNGGPSEGNGPEFSMGFKVSLSQRNFLDTPGRLGDKSAADGLSKRVTL